MSDDHQRMSETISVLRQQCDELALQIHLGNMEAKQEFEAAKDKLDQLTAEFDPLKNAVAESAGDVLASLKLVGEEVLTSFDRVRKALP